MTRQLYIEIRNYLSKLIKGTEWENHVFCVGGCVRDMTLMKDEIKDIDLVIDLPNGGVCFAEWVKETGNANGEVVTFPTYGTAMFHLKQYPSISIECVQTRSEKYTDRNSRKPETCYGTLEEDAFRRDLTINALYWDLSNCKILDPTGKGFDDIGNKVIRTTNDNPDVVFIDDPLRILRVVRFSTRLGWDIDNFTLESMKRNVDRLRVVSMERINEEFGKMLVSDDPVVALTLLSEIGALKYIIPELIETQTLKQNRYHDYNTVWEHTMLVLSKTPPTLKLRMAALLHDIGKVKTVKIKEDGEPSFILHECVSATMATTILDRLRYSTQFRNEVCFLICNHMTFKRCGNGEDFFMKAKSFNHIVYRCRNMQTMWLCGGR